MEGPVQFQQAPIQIQGVSANPTTGSATTVPPSIAVLPTGTILRGMINQRPQHGSVVLHTDKGDITLRTDITLKRGMELAIKLEKAQDEMMARIISVDGKSLAKYVESISGKSAEQDVIVREGLMKPGQLPTTETAAARPGQAAPPPPPQQALTTILLNNTVSKETLATLPKPIADALIQAPPGSQLAIRVTGLDVPGATPTQQQPATAPTTPAQPGVPTQPATTPAATTTTTPGNVAPQPAVTTTPGAPPPATPTVPATSPQAPITTTQQPGNAPTAPATTTPSTPATPQAPVTTTTATPAAVPNAPATPQQSTTTQTPPPQQPAASAPGTPAPPTSTTTTTTAPNTPAPAAPTTTAAPQAPAAATTTATPPAINPATAAPTPPGTASATTTAAPPPPPVNPAGVITATVLQGDSNNSLTLQSPIGTIRLLSPTPLQPGTRISFMIQQVMPATPEATAATGSDPSLLAGRSMESFRDILSYVAPTPQAVGSISAHAVPRGGKELTTEMLFMISALKGGDIRRWLGSKNSHQLNMEKPELMKKLMNDFNNLRSMMNEPREAMQWGNLTLPFVMGDDTVPLRIFYRQGGSGGDNGEDGSNEFSEHFLLDLTFSNLGHMQFDGFLRKGSQMAFDLIVRSERELDKTMQADIQAIYMQAQEISGFTGTVAFRSGYQELFDLDAPETPQDEGAHSIIV